MGISIRQTAARWICIYAVTLIAALGCVILISENELVNTLIISGLLSLCMIMMFGMASAYYLAASEVRIREVAKHKYLLIILLCMILSVWLNSGIFTMVSICILFTLVFVGIDRLVWEYESEFYCGEDRELQYAMGRYRYYFIRLSCPAIIFALGILGVDLKMILLKL